MDKPAWTDLSEDLRDRLDELICADDFFAAVSVLWKSGSPDRLNLAHCQRLVSARRIALGGRVRPRPEPPRDLPTLLAAVEALPFRPDAIEALWDGDTQGWMVCIDAVAKDGHLEHELACIRHGGDIRLFNGQVPPWSEAAEAIELGTALAERLGVPFYFEHPDTPDLPENRWWDTAT